jgi:hypothetical protein
VEAEAEEEGEEEAEVTGEAEAEEECEEAAPGALVIAARAASARNFGVASQAAAAPPAGRPKPARLTGSLKSRLETNQPNTRRTRLSVRERLAVRKQKDSPAAAAGQSAAADEDDVQHGDETNKGAAEEGAAEEGGAVVGAAAGVGRRSTDRRWGACHRHLMEEAAATMDHPSDNGREVGGSSRQGDSHEGRGRTLTVGAAREARASSSPATTRMRDVAAAFLPNSVPGTPSAAATGAARLQRLLEEKDEEVQRYRRQAEEVVRFRREAEERQQLWASARQGMADEWEAERSLLLAELESLRGSVQERRASKDKDKDKDRDRDEKDDKAEAARARHLLKEEGLKRAAAESKRRGAEQLVATLKRELTVASDCL